MRIAQIYLEWLVAMVGIHMESSPLEACSLHGYQLCSYTRSHIAHSLSPRFLHLEVFPKNLSVSVADCLTVSLCMRVCASMYSE